MMASSFDLDVRQHEVALPEANQPALRQLLIIAEMRGHVTHAEVAAAQPLGQASSDVIEDALATLSRLGIEVVEATDDEDAPSVAPATTEEADNAADGGNLYGAGHTDDPTGLYIRKMGTHAMLSR